jgi:unsaturated rhamnogalacturonyl hydrolase
LSRVARILIGLVAVACLPSCGLQARPVPIAVTTRNPEPSAVAPRSTRVSDLASPAPAAALLATDGPPIDVAILTVTNPTNAARSSETLSVNLAELRRCWAEPHQVLLVDSAGTPVLSQLVDLQGNGSPDELVFQTDLAADETKKFTLRFGKPKTLTPEQFKVYGRFVRERHDDFAWENDRIARRMYGPELETFPEEPLTSSGIDVWVKRTPRLVINDWYMTNDYHLDRGEGADLYSVGPSRGCGGLGIWSKQSLYVSRNFTKSRVLANGPLRLVFELSYAPFDAAGLRLTETKRVTLDAGKNFERYESTFESNGTKPVLSVGIGIARHRGTEVQIDPKGTWMRTWERLSEKDGHLGCAVVLPPNIRATPQHTDSDFLLVVDTTKGGPLVYHAGFGWDKSGVVVDATAFTEMVQRVSREAATPARLSLSAGSGAKPWSARACEAMIDRRPDAITGHWAYDVGLVLMGCQRVAQRNDSPKFRQFVKRTVDDLIAPDGSIKGYDPQEYNLDHLNMGNVLFSLLQEARDPGEKRRYERALSLLRSQMKTHPRTLDGGFWHKQIYPHQLWLDGAYMAGPFLAKYAAVFKEPSLYDDVARELIVLERHTRDPKTGLLYHGWDESRTQRWADPSTGRSPSFWGRSIGWYAMALVDVIDLMPKTHAKRGALLAILDRLAAAIAATQDRQAGVWWQVLDAPRRDKNYLEASASAMFVYALSKGVNRGWLESGRYAPIAERGYRGILGKFVDVDDKGWLDLRNVCKVAGLGGTPYRDGTYEYYTSTEVVTNDPKGVGAFVVASLERE